MTRKQKRLSVIAGALGFLGLATALTFYALGQKASYFFMPGDLQAATLSPDQRIRLGGLVEKGSIVRDAGPQVHFTVTDGDKTVPVVYVGILPDLFREGQGVITEGTLGADGIFKADSVLAKHDETYMPKEVADSLKEKGVWNTN
jgi:cytochrome c-type biogenesis protein CcmE